MGCENGHTEECRAKMEKIKADFLKESNAKIAQNACSDLVPMDVIKAVIKAWPDQAVEILTELRFAGDHYSFNRWGMYVGIEYDGYIHT